MTSTDTTITPRHGYAGLWRGLPRELGYLLVAFPLALAGFGVTLTLFSGGLGTLVTFFIGVVLIIGALYVSRGFGQLELSLLAWAGRPAIVSPDWQDARARTGFFGWLRSVLGNGHYWLYLLYVMILDFVVTLVTWTIVVTWVSIGLVGVTAWFWNLIWPGAVSISDADAPWWLGWLDDGSVLAGVFIFLSGVVALATLPLVTRGLVTLHWLVARGVLGAWKSDALEREVATLAESRGAAHSAEGHSLRRLERDIHDGPQQRLVRLQMDLAAAERQLDSDPVKARGLIAEAMQQSRDALEELRALSRGFAPPILLDRGLVAALESAAARSVIPTRVISELPDEVELPQEIERNAYFVASEAMMNAGKHSGATAIEVRVWTHRLPDAETTWLHMTVSDNGTGGAIAVAGHGIVGLQERLRGLGGTLQLSSPTGGPTVLTAELPVTVASSV